MCSSVTASHAKKPGFDDSRPHSRWDWWLSATVVTKDSLTWFSLKWLAAAALVLEADCSRVGKISLVLTTWNCGIVQCKAQDHIY